MSEVHMVKVEAVGGDVREARPGEMCAECGEPARAVASVVYLVAGHLRAASLSLCQECA